MNYRLNFTNLKILLINVLFIFLIIIKIFYKKESNILINNNKNINKYKEQKVVNDNIYQFPKNISLYKYLKVPEISIILKNINNKEEKIYFLKNLNILKNYDYDNNIEINFLISKNLSIKFNNITNNYFFNLKNIKIIEIENNENYIENIIQNIKGKYVIILDDLLFLEKDILDKFVNNTYGKINNIYEYKMKKNNKKYYLIKTKILRDLIDEGKYFKEINDLYTYILNLPNPNVNYISISFCLDDNYILNAYVAIISILDNKNDNTYISFYLIVSKDFKRENIDIILSLYEQYELFNITFIRMNNQFDNVTTFRYITKSAYYKLILADLLPKLNKIINFDSDIIVYKDLFNLFNHNFNNYLILASPIFGSYKYRNQKKSYNTGILLLNLQKMRETNFTQKIKEIINNGFKDTKYFLHDQAIINQFFFEYIGDLEFEYNSRNNLFKYSSKYYIEKEDYLNYINLINSEKYPYIYHFTGDNKPIKHQRKNSEDWWYYARKGKYFQKILDNL